MAGNNPKRQHWVPRFYLTEFATLNTRQTKDPQVWVAAKEPKGEKDKTPFRLNIENVAAESFLYSPLAPDGSRDFSVEKLLGGMEGLLARRWDHVANSFVNLKEDHPLKKMLALFVATMIARHPDKVERMKKMHAGFVEMYDRLPKDSDGRPKISHVVHDGIRHEFDASKWDEFRDGGDDYIRHMFAENIRREVIELSADLLAKKWSIVVADEPVFATSDRPVRMCHPTEKRFGTRTPGTVIEFPLSPTRFLMIHDFAHASSFDYHPLKGGPGPINVTTWLSANRFFISHAEPTPLISNFIEFAESVNPAPVRVLKYKGMPDRNSRCLCGSGRKWKRCCGRNA